MKKIIILIIFQTSILSYSQVNLIQNGNFEISDEYDWASYCMLGPIINDYVFSWESQQSNKGKYKKSWQHIKFWQKVEDRKNGCRCASFHLPNWGYDGNIGEVVALGEYELIQQKFQQNKKLNSNKYYKLTFDFLLPDYVINIGGTPNVNLGDFDKLVFYIAKIKQNTELMGGLQIIMRAILSQVVIFIFVIVIG